MNDYYAIKYTDMYDNRIHTKVGYNETGATFITITGDTTYPIANSSQVRLDRRATKKFIKHLKYVLRRHKLCKD